jgi:hypothetical protein
MKNRMLIDKIKADFSTPTKAQLEIELSRTPMNVTYDQELALFRNMVNNKKHPPLMGAVSRRHVNGVSTAARGRGRGGYGRGVRGRRGRGGRGNSRLTRSDSKMITLTDGTQLEYHASFNFPRHM